jgi:hypothetical protein
VAVSIEGEGSVAASSGFGQELVTWDLEAGKEVVRRTASGTRLDVSFLILGSSEDSTVDGSSTSICSSNVKERTLIEGI